MRWWVLLSDSPEGLHLDVTYTDRPYPDPTSPWWLPPYYEHFTPMYEQDSYWLDVVKERPDWFDSDITLSANGGEWKVQSYTLRADSSGLMFLHAVYASEPPGFGWWMPSLRDESL